MRVPLSWLREYLRLDVEPTDRDAVVELGRVFDSLGLVVEGIEFVGAGLSGVVLARVVEIRAIEGADRIRLAVVDGGGPELEEVVCGAQNYAVGDVVPLARVGVTLPNGMEIGRRKMRGVTSNGMLCSGRELDIGDDHEGLLILSRTGSATAPLPEGTELGQQITTFLAIVPDAVFDLSIEPNRPDCLSMIGIARDLAARLRVEFTSPVAAVNGSGPPVETLGSVAIFAPERCERLVARVLQQVTVVDSPPEVARRLTLAGMRPINSVVDASNYVMLELGQPTHPYDLERLGGRGIGVRLARPGESLVTLDGVERVLALSDQHGNRDEDLVITDAEDRVVGLAGVMGGSSSEISLSTTEVLLEVAAFAPIGIGRTAARMGLRSEASARFWRGIDPEGLVRAADRFCQLVVEAASAAGVTPPVVAHGVLEHRISTAAPRRVQLRTGRLNAVLGLSLTTAEIAGLLAPIGFSSIAEGEGLIVEIPSFRPDASREVDLIEEVARHHGYERIAPTERRSPFVGRLTDRQSERRAIGRLLTGLGAFEAWTSSIVDPTIEERIGSGAPPVALANPIARLESALRTHLLPGLVAAVRHNEAHRNPDVRLFEIGSVFSAPGTAGERPHERELIAVALCQLGDDAATAVNAWWHLVDGLALDRGPLRIDQPPPGGQPLSDPIALGCHPTRSALVLARTTEGDERVVAVVGEIDPAVLVALGATERRVGWLAVDADVLRTCRPVSADARPVSRYPSADVDLAFVLPEEVAANFLEAEINTGAGDLRESVRLVDVYRGRGVADGSRSLSYRVRLCAIDRTLSDFEIAEARRAIIDHVESALPARLRA